MLTDNPSKFQAFVTPIGKWMNETPAHVPLTDCYDTRTGKMMALQERSVVGSVFIKALADKDLVVKWLNFKP